MPLEQEVQVYHKKTRASHLFAMQIASFLEGPRKGDIIDCQVCGEKGEVTHLGTPGRLPRNEPPPSQDQTSMLKE